MSLVIIPEVETIDGKVVLIAKERTELDPNLARALAAVLHSCADSVERETKDRLEQERIAAIPPADRTARQLCSGEPVPEDNSHTEIQPATGMQKEYVVLSAEERARGFVRPVRVSYRHVGMLSPIHPLRDLTEEETKRYASFNYVKYEEYGPERSPVTGRFWTQAQLDHIGKGCGQVTTMNRSIAETFARDPEFYSGGYCAICKQHYPNEEFRWLDGSKVGE